MEDKQSVGVSLAPMGRDLSKIGRRLGNSTPKRGIRTNLGAKFQKILQKLALIGKIRPLDELIPKLTGFVEEKEREERES